MCEGSVDQPTLAGSAPQNGSAIIYGGAAITINAQNYIVLNGTITVRGGAGDGYLGGASGGGQKHMYYIKILHVIDVVRTQAPCT